MAVIEYDSYKQKLLAMSDTFENLQRYLPPAVMTFRQGKIR